MKQLVLKSLSVFFAFMLFGVQTFAFTLKSSSAITKSEIQSVSEFDDSEIYDAFAGIADLEQYLANNSGKTYSEVNQDNSLLLNGVSSTTSLPLNASGDQRALGIPSFLWGCVFNVVGILIVYLVTDDTTQTKQALYGCLVGTAVWVILNFTAFSSSSSL
jgi:hypothetical protein